MQDGVDIGDMHDVLNVKIRFQKADFPLQGFQASGREKQHGQGAAVDIGNLIKTDGNEQGTPFDESVNEDVKVLQV